jgi:hypothetical protein
MALASDRALDAAPIVRPARAYDTGQQRFAAGTPTLQTVPAWRSLPG